MKYFRRDGNSFEEGVALLAALLQIMNFAQRSQLFGSGFRSYIPLWHAQHLEAHHELADGGGAQEGRIEMGVKMPFSMRFAVGRRLVEAHGVRERGLEEIVVPSRHPLKDIRQQGLSSGEPLKIADVRF